jgi:hypothetical protein
MTKYSTARLLLFASALSFTGLSSRGADTGGNLITNGGFEAGMQFWNGDGNIVQLPNGNRVCEIEASKSRMKDIHQEFHLKQLQQVEVVFRARSIDYKGPGIRISIHLHDSGSVFWIKQLPEDGSWQDFRIKYARTTANVDLRELVIATLLGAGKIQLDDVEVREPSQMADNQPDPPVATSTPEANPAAPLAFVKPPPAPAPFAAVPQPSAPQAVPPGTFSSQEEIIKSTPADILRKLQNDATVDTGANEIDEYFARSVKGQPARLRLNIDNAKTRPSGENKFLLHVLDHRATTWNGARISAWLWVKFPEASMPPDKKLAKGSEVTFSGVISRCEIGKAGGLHLNVDLEQSKLEGH